MKTVEEEKKDLVGLTGDDFDYIQRARNFGRELHREVYRHVLIVVELDKALEFLSEDIKKELAEFVENWPRWYEKDLTSVEPKENLPGISEKITREIEKMLSGYLPDCQLNVLKKLQKRLPAGE
jgi:hypothetical protein